MKFIQQLCSLFYLGFFRSSGLCENDGLVPVLELDACAEALQYLYDSYPNLANYPSVEEGIYSSGYPKGCYMYNDVVIKFNTHETGAVVAHPNGFQICYGGK